MKHPFDHVLMDNSKYGFLSTIKNTLFWVSVYFNTQILIKDAIFTSPKMGQAFHIAIKAIKGLAICRANTVAPGIEPMTSHFAVKRSSNWANLTTVYYGEVVCLLREGKHSGPGDRTHDIPLCSQAL